MAATMGDDWLHKKPTVRFMLNYYITEAMIGNAGLVTLRTIDSAIKMNELINAAQDPCDHAGYGQFQSDLFPYGDKRSNACQHHIYNSLHEYHRMLAPFPVYRRDHERLYRVDSGSAFAVSFPIASGYNGLSRAYRILLFG